MCFAVSRVSTPLIACQKSVFFSSILIEIPVQRWWKKVWFKELLQKYLSNCNNFDSFCCVIVPPFLIAFKFLLFPLICWEFFIKCKQRDNSFRRIAGVIRRMYVQLYTNKEVATTTDSITTKQSNSDDTEEEHHWVYLNLIFSLI